MNANERKRERCVFHGVCCSIAEKRNEQVSWAFMNIIHYTAATAFEAAAEIVVSLAMHALSCSIRSTE